MPRCTLP